MSICIFCRDELKMYHTGAADYYLGHDNCKYNCMVKYNDCVFDGYLFYINDVFVSTSYYENTTRLISDKELLYLTVPLIEFDKLQPEDIIKKVNMLLTFS